MTPKTVEAANYGKIFSKNMPAVVKPSAAALELVKRFCDKSRAHSGGAAVLKMASKWCIVALMLALRKEGIIPHGTELKNDNRRHLMLALRSRWWPCSTFAGATARRRRRARAVPSGSSGCRR